MLKIMKSLTSLVKSFQLSDFPFHKLYITAYAGAVILFAWCVTSYRIIFVFKSTDEEESG